jgi:hypothetical protein
MQASSVISNRARVRAMPAALAALLLPPGIARAQDEEAPPTLALSEVPSFGASRPGPVRPSTPAASPPAEAEAEAEPPPGVAPVQFQIPNLAIDGPVELGKIEDGVMIDPTGPWVITWYEQLSSLGEGSNVVMAGHVDYWTTGPAILWPFKDPGIGAGEIIQVTAEDGQLFEYQVEWSELFNVAEDLTPEVIQNEIVGETDVESLTVITCGGAFDQATGEYLERQVVRATLIS